MQVSGFNSSGFINHKMFAPCSNKAKTAQRHHIAAAPIDSINKRSRTFKIGGIISLLALASLGALAAAYGVYRNIHLLASIPWSDIANKVVPHLAPMGAVALGSISALALGLWGLQRRQCSKLRQQLKLATQKIENDAKKPAPPKPIPEKEVPKAADNNEDQLNQALAKQKQEKAVIEGKVSQLTQEMEKKTQEMTLLSSKIEKFSQDLAKEVKEKDTISLKVTELTKALEVSEKKVEIAAKLEAQLLKSLDEVKQESAEIQNQASQIKQELEKHTQKVEVAFSNGDELKQDFTNAIKEKDEISRKVEELTQALEATEKKYECATQGLSSIEALEKINQEKDLKIEQLEEAVEAEKKQQKSLEQKFSLLRRTCDRLEKMNQQHELNINELIQKHDLDINELTQKIKKADVLNEDLEREFQENELQIERLEKTLELERQSQDALVNDYEKLKDVNESQKVTIEQQTIEIDKFKVYKNNVAKISEEANSLIPETLSLLKKMEAFKTPKERGSIIELETKVEIVNPEQTIADETK